MLDNYCDIVTLMVVIVWPLASSSSLDKIIRFILTKFKTKATNNLLHQEIFPKVDSVSNRVQEEVTKCFVGGLETSEKCNDGDQNV